MTGTRKLCDPNRGPLKTKGATPIRGSSSASRMGRLGFEPRTNRLKAECSTAELATHNLQAVRKPH